MRSLLLVVLCLLAGCADPKPGILVMAHGGDPAWNADVEATVAPLRAKWPTEIAFGMATPSTLQEAVARLEQQGVRRIAVVRMFISGDSFLGETEYILGLRPELPAAQVPTPGQSDIQLAAATEHNDDSLGEADHGSHCMERPRQITTNSTLILSRAGVAESPLVDEILLDRVRTLSTEPSRERILILAHGPGDQAENERWLAHMRMRVQRIHDFGAFKHVQCETLREDWPEKRAEAEQRIRAYVEAAHKEGCRVIVVPFRVAGFGPYKETLTGLEYAADGRGFCPHPNMTRWIEQVAADCLGRRPGGE